MNRQVVRYGEENRIGSMGTTTAFVAFSRDGVYVGNLGDSRVYCSEKDRLQQISVDHVIGRSFLGKPPLTQYLGITEEGMVLEPCITKHPYVAGDRYLLCSDGMTDMLSDGEIADILTREIYLEETVSVFLDRVLEKGGRDNVTIILCEIKETENGSGENGKNTPDRTSWRENSMKNRMNDLDFEQTVAFDSVKDFEFTRKAAQKESTR